MLKQKRNYLGTYFSQSLPFTRDSAEIMFQPDYSQGPTAKYS